MSRYAHNDVAVRGTSRWQRHWGFERFLSQAEFGRHCTPKAPQAWISQFDLAQFKLDRAGAARYASALCHLRRTNSPQDRASAIRETWALWFANVENYGDADVKLYADEIRKNASSEVCSLEATPLFDPNQNPDFAQASALTAEVVPLAVPVAPAKAVQA